MEGFFGKAFIDPYLAYKLGNVLVSMRTGCTVDISDPWMFFFLRVCQVNPGDMGHSGTRISLMQGSAIIFCRCHTTDDVWICMSTTRDGEQTLLFAGPG